MLAHPKIGQPDPRPGGRPVRRAVSRTTTDSSANASGKQVAARRELLLERRIRDTARVVGAPGRAPPRAAIELRILETDDVRPARDGLARGQQRVEVGVEADRQVGDRDAEVALVEPRRSRIRPAEARYASTSRPIRAQSRATASAARERRRVRCLVRADDLDRQRVLGVRRPPAIGGHRPAGGLEARRRDRRVEAERGIGLRIEQRRRRRVSDRTRRWRAEPKTSSIDRDRSIASRRAVRTRGSENSG